MKNKLALLSVIVFSTTLVVVQLFPIRASAFSTRPTYCADINLNKWDWVIDNGKDKDRNNQAYDGMKHHYPTFSNLLSKYVIGRTGSSVAPTTTMFYLANQTEELQFSKSGSVYKLKSSGGGGIYAHNMVDTPFEVYEGTQYNNTYTQVQSGSAISENTTLSCVWRTGIVEYDTANGWDLGTFTVAQLDDVADTGQSEVSCSWNDLGCHVSKLANALSDTIKELATFTVRLFIPTGDQLGDLAWSMHLYLTGKLGVLLYPFDWLSDVYDALLSDSNNWCSESNCTKSFGDYFGKPLSINFTVLHTVAPTLWDYGLLMLRGVTIIGLVVMFKRKFSEVTRQ